MSQPVGQSLLLHHHNLSWPITSHGDESSSLNQSINQQIMISWCHHDSLWVMTLMSQLLRSSCGTVHWSKQWGLTVVVVPHAACCFVWWACWGSMYAARARVVMQLVRHCRMFIKHWMIGVSAVSCIMPRPSTLKQLRAYAQWNFSLKTWNEKFWVCRPFFATRTRLHAKRQPSNHKTRRARALWRERGKQLRAYAQWKVLSAPALFYY